MISIDCTTAKPLATVRVKTDEGSSIRVADGQGRPYLKQEGRTAEFVVSGALGQHVVTAHDENGAELGRTGFRVNCQTELQEPGGTFVHLLHMLKYTFYHEQARQKIVVADEDRVYWNQAITSRDSVHAIKGARYFCYHNRDIIDVSSKYQCDDGMVWDFVKPASERPRHMEWRLPDRWTERAAGNRLLFQRQPVENDCEHMFIRGVYLVWQATGDDEWMAGKLDSALKAMRFSRTDPYFWSEKFQLLKRPYTIDTWDWTSQYDGLDGDTMNAAPGQTVYGVMFGDNTGMADSCRKLAEMLDYIGRPDEAREANEFAEHLQQRVDEVSWNGEFYTHHVSEDPSFERDFGVDESEQVSLSNSYSLNRGIAHDKAVSIIRTYQRLREEMPASSPGEWYQIYPPFEKGWGLPKWQYMNGAVTPLVAGELARGALVHGFEEYGVDVLTRMHDAFAPFGEHFVRGLRGKMPEAPERSFQTLDLRPVANAGLTCRSEADSPAWTDQPGYDCRNLPRGRQVLEDVPFDIIADDQNGGRACLRLSHDREGYAERTVVGVGHKFRSLYLLHCSEGPRNPIAGAVTFHYGDGSQVTRYIAPGKNVSSFWIPQAPYGSQFRKACWHTVVAWQGECPHFWDVGLIGHGMENPRPDQQVESIELTASKEGAIWFVVGLTTSDAPVFFMPNRTTGGVPPNWSCGSVMLAMAEGMMGVVDRGRNMDTVTISPRWDAAGLCQATACLKYEEGAGYVRYTYEKTDHALKLHVAASSDQRRFELLLPEGFEPGTLTVNSEQTPYDIKTVESSGYACFDRSGIGAVEIALLEGS